MANVSYWSHTSLLVFNNGETSNIPQLLKTARDMRPVAPPARSNLNMQGNRSVLFRPPPQKKK